MRVLALWLAACQSSVDNGGDDSGEDTDTTDTDGTAPPPCGADVVATRIHGATSLDVIDPGDVVPIVSGPQGGFHMELGLAIESPTTSVAWRIDLYDAATGDVVGGVGLTPYTALADYDEATCVGHLSGRVFIGDGSSQSHDFACGLAGTAIEARGWAEPLPTFGETPTDAVEVTLAIVAGDAC